MTDAPLDFRPDEHGFLIAEARLPSWAGFHDRSGGYATAGAAEASSGTVQVVASAEDDDPTLAPEDVTAAAWLLANEAAVAAAVRAAIFAEYPAQKELYGYTEDEQRRFMPDIASEDDLKALIGLHAVHLHGRLKDGLPYLGFEFGCTWDDEHGLGVMMHGTRLVELGGADTAILTWIADQDAEGV